MTRRARITPWLVLLVFAVLALGLSYPLPLRLTTHTPGSATWAFDESTFLWNIWYFRHALLDLHSSPLHSDLIWYPLGIDLILYTYNFLNALLAFPLQLAWGLVPASNVTLLLATTLSGFGAYLLARDLLVSWRRRPIEPATLMLAPWVAGLIYAFASNRAIYAALGHYDMVSTGFIPFYALYLARLMRRPSWRDGALAGLFFALCALAEMIFAVFLAIFTLVALLSLLPWLRSRLTRDGWLRLLSGLAVAAFVAAVVWGPVLVPIVKEFISGDYALEGWGEGLKLSTDLLGFVTPTALHPLWGEDWTRALRAVEEGTARFSDVNTVFLGWITLALALVGWAAAGQAGRPWRWVAALFAAFCMGPLLQINGQYEFSLDRLLGDRGVTFPLPFALLHYIPFVKANRAPNRNSVILMLALAVLAGYGTAWWLSQGRRRAVRWLTRMTTLVLAAGVLFEHAAVPLPMTDARIPDVYRQIAQEPGEFSILQLPLGWRNSFGVFGAERTQIQYYQTAHGKPMLGGNISRAPEFKMAYFRRIPLFQAIADVEFGRPVPPEVDAAARAQAGDLMYLFNVRYLIVLPPIPGRLPYADTYASTREYVLEVLPVDPQPVYDRDGIQVYRVRQPEGSPGFSLDLGTGDTAPYRGEGWHDDEMPFGVTANWIGARAARLFIPIRKDETGQWYRLSLRARPFSYPGGAQQSLWVQVNGHRLAGEVPLPDDWTIYAFQVPSDWVRDGLNEVQIHLAWVAHPRDVIPGSALIGSTGIEAPVDLEIHSTQEFAYITLEDDAGVRVDGSAGRQGYNVAVIDPDRGRLIEKRGFDTAANEYEAARLAEYLQRIPSGAIVVVASRGQAQAHLTDDAWAAMQSIGAAQDPRARPQAAHVIVGIKGAAPGTAAELLDEQGAYLRIGRNPDRRFLGAAVDWISMEPMP